MNGLPVLKLFLLLNGDFIFFVVYLHGFYKVPKPRMTKLGYGVEVRAHYPIQFFYSVLVLAHPFLP